MKTATKNRIADKVSRNGKDEAKGVELVITAPNFQTAVFHIRGDSPYVQNKFSQKAKDTIIETQKAGQAGKKGKAKQAKDFKALYEGAKHISEEGWCGIPATAFRCAMISACKMVGFVMTRAKLSLFVEADGFDKDDGTPLVKITKGKPKQVEHPVRNDNGSCDIRPRPMWNPGWEAKVRVRFEADQFTLEDVTNLMHRVGLQVGVGEGRHDSKKSNGQGWGTFSLLAKKGGAK